MEDLFGCNIGGNMNDSRFNKPMPWIGIYIVAASLAISMAMAADAFLGFRYKKLWFPCKFFSLNATSLTLIAVVVKLSLDLNTAMPKRQDQLAKLSSAVLLCTVMGNSMPSIGVMENQEIFMNMIALGILVITLVVNICIQLATGAIYIYWKEHIFIMFLMLVLLLIISFTALTVPTNKKYFEIKYLRKFESVIKEGSANDIKNHDVVRMRNDLMKYWIMAHTSCQQFVMGRSVTCTASGAFCLLAALTLAQAIFRTYLTPWRFRFCEGESDYKWSTTLILVTQTVAVGVGTIAPAFRWFMAVNFRCCPKKRNNKSLKEEFKIERYWTKKLMELKECPLTLHVHNRHFKKLAHDSKTLVLDVCIGVQNGIVVASKFIRLLSIFVISKFFFFIHCCIRMKSKIKSNSISSESGSDPSLGPIQDLSHFVLRLEGEEECVEMMMKDDCNATDRWIKMGKRKKPKNLILLLQKSTHNLKGATDFESNQVPSLDSEEPTNCWALPIVTMTTIAAALPNIDHHLVNKLKNSVNEGLVYVRLVDNNLDDKQDLSNIRAAAEVVWLGVDLYHKWQDVDLRKMSSQTKCPMEILEELSNTAKNIFKELKSKYVSECIILDNPSHWPIKLHAANSMYRVSQAILQHHKTRNYQTGERLFEEISLMISDMISACFTNLPHVITKKCFQNSFGTREEGVRQAIFLLGKTEKIMKMLKQKVLPGVNPNEGTTISEWCLLCKLSNPCDFKSPSTNEVGRLSSSDLYLTIKE